MQLHPPNIGMFAILLPTAPITFIVHINPLFIDAAQLYIYYRNLQKKYSLILLFVERKWLLCYVISTYKNRAAMVEKVWT